MHYLPFGDRLNKGILMVTQLIKGFCCFRSKFQKIGSLSIVGVKR